MQKPTGGAQRHVDATRPARLHATIASRVNRRSIRAARALQAWLRGGVSRSSGLLGARLSLALRPLTTAERALPIAVAAIVAVATLLTVLPNTPRGAVGGTQGSGTSVRLAVNGGIDRYEDPTQAADIEGLKAPNDANFQPVTLPTDVTTDPGADQVLVDQGVVLDDGTLVTGYAPQTAVEDGADLIQTYRVKSGDTLSTIAHRFHVTTMTLWWANKLPAKDALHVGQVLRIPPVSGLVYTVRDTDTLDSLASRYDVSAADIITINGLADPTLVVGQVLILPGARGAPIPTPKPTPRTSHPASKSSGGTASGGPARYSGGRFRWPVVGGNNYISQYYHYGHWAIDIAATYGTPVVAGGAGKVIFAGWKSNGGGWQVWISHGSNLYTTYNHMSALTVGTGQYVSRGQQVGRIGQSGDATGPHLHFEVWVGPIWNGGTRMNPLNYL